MRLSATTTKALRRAVGYNPRKTPAVMKKQQFRSIQVDDINAKGEKVKRPAVVTKTMSLDEACAKAAYNTVKKLAKRSPNKKALTLALQRAARESEGDE